MKNKKFLLILILFFSTFAFGSVEFNEICYKLNKDTLTYEEIRSVHEKVDNSANALANRMLTWVKGNDNYRACDKIVMVNTSQFNVKSKNVTVQSMTKELTSSGDVDFIAINDSQDSYFIGFVSKNFGIGTGYIISKSLDYDNNGSQHITYTLEHVNFKKFMVDKIEQYCKVYKTAPNIVINTFAFSNFTNIYMQGKSIADTEANAAQLKDTGLLLLDENICNSRKSIINTINNITTHESGGQKGWSTNYGNKLFRNNGYIINYPYISADKIDQIIGAYFANVMYDNNIKRGIMFSDKIIDIKTRHWTTGKSWKKKDHVEKKLNINSESYDITYTSIPLPFEEISVTSNWPNNEMTYVTAINPIPSLNNNYYSFTSDNHIMTHSFKKGGEINSDGKYYYEKKVSKKRKFNWALFIAIIVVVVVASVFTFGVGSFGFAGNFTVFTQAVGNTTYLGLGILGTGAQLSLAGVAASTLAGSLIAMPIAAGNGIHVNSTQIKTIVSNAMDDVIKSGSVKVTSLTMIPTIIERLEPLQFVSGSAYKSIVSHSKDTIDNAEWNMDWGTVANYIIYENRKVKIGTFYNQEFFNNLYQTYINNMFINPNYNNNTNILESSNILKTIMVREWINSVKNGIKIPEPAQPIVPGSDDNPPPVN